jgi:hypothetical protein
MHQREASSGELNSRLFCLCADMCAAHAQAFDDVAGDLCATEEWKFVRGDIDYPFLEKPLPALRRLVLAAGGRAEHLAFTGDR